MWRSLCYFHPLQLLHVPCPCVTRNSRGTGYTFVLHLMACSIKNAPPTEAAVNKLLSKVGGTLEQALNSQELRWSSKRLDADDAHVVAYVVALSTVLQKLVLGANFIGDAGASSIAEAPAQTLLFSTPRHPRS